MTVFTIAHMPVAPTIEQLVADALTSESLLWWHQIPNYWVVIDHSDRFNAEVIQKRLEELLGKHTWFLVIEADHLRWAIFAPQHINRWILDNLQDKPPVE